jgi:hypothetical protein
MKNQSSKLQPSSSREIPSTKRQNSGAVGLEFETWCFSGDWRLDVGALETSA